MEAHLHCAQCAPDLLQNFPTSNVPCQSDACCIFQQNSVSPPLREMDQQSDASTQFPARSPSSTDSALTKLALSAISAVNFMRTALYSSTSDRRVCRAQWGPRAFRNAARDYQKKTNSGNCVRPMFCLCIRPLIYWANPANMFKWRMCWTHVCVIFPYDIKSCHLTLFAGLSSHLTLALTISNLLKHKSYKFGRKIFRLNACRSMRGMRNAWPSCPRQHLLKFFHLGREIGRTLQLGDLDKCFGQSNPSNRVRPERQGLLIVLFWAAACIAVDHALFVCCVWARAWRNPQRSWTISPAVSMSSVRMVISPACLMARGAVCSHGAKEPVLTVLMFKFSLQVDVDMLWRLGG